MEKITITITGKEAKEAKKAFLGWWHDGGGESGFTTTAWENAELEEFEWKISD